MIIYSTKIDIEKCKNRIDAIIMSERYLADGLRGEVDFDRSTFYIRKIKPNFRSVCIRNLHCELIKKENKTIIKGEFRMDFVAEIIF